MAQIINILTLDIIELIWKLKLTSIILSIVFGSFFVYFFMQFQRLIQFKVGRIKSLYSSLEPAKGGAVQSKWEEIVHHSRSSHEAEWKLAIIEADKLIDGLLKSAGYPGETMGDRLMSIEGGQLESLNGLWEAHKIRNKLVHETSYFLRFAEAQRALQLYERTLKELQAI